MGKSIDKTEFTPADHRQFKARLLDNLNTMADLLRTPGFGTGPASFGAELELYLVDHEGLPVMINRPVQEAFNDERLTLELNRYNLEYNLSPVAAAGCPFSTLKCEMETALTTLDQIAEPYRANILPIGILPTLTTAHLGMHAITDVPRYHVLADALKERRGSDFRIRITGLDKLDMRWSDVTPEGANTSFQFHYRVAPNDFRDAFNAAQLVTPLGLALAANSPLFLGKKLWQETRIALFKQSIDCRMEDPLSMRQTPRVFFGNGWLREGILELFSEGIYLFPPLLPLCKNPVAGEMPPCLHELRLHQGSIWTWNRPIYDPQAGGHLRIELRALPAGPTPLDMLATAALTVGLIEEFRKQINDILPAIPFKYAEHNFYRSAKYGLNAVLFWPNFAANTLEEKPVTDILEELLPMAETGLSHLDVEKEEITTYLSVANNTLISRQNGASWQLSTLQKLEQGTDKYSALKKLVQRYQSNYREGMPVHQWR